MVKMLCTITAFVAATLIAVPVSGQTSIGPPTSGGAVTGQTTGGYLSPDKLIDRQVAKLRRYPPKVATLLDSNIEESQVEDAYKKFLSTGQRMSPLEFLASAMAMREALPSAEEQKSRKLTTLQSSLASAGLLTVKAHQRSDAEVAFSGTPSTGYDARVKAAKLQLEDEIKKK